ncbi:MAG: acyl carrier protein [Prevotella sp.]|jgi:acyl carrier protein|nr:acyl carrier protein [Prevotella sp.]
MNNTILQAEIIDILENILELDRTQITLETCIQNISQWDSLHQVIIISSLEEKYNIIFPDDVLFELTSVEAIVREVSKLI